MVTFPAGRIAQAALIAVLCTACSREQQDWRAAEGADTAEAWQQFLEQHPDSERATQARQRIAEMSEQLDWLAAEREGSLEAYRAFLSQHSHGHRAEEARIRIEGFSLGSAPRMAAVSPEETPAVGARVRALHLGSSAAPHTAPPAASVASTAPSAAPAAAPAAAPTTARLAAPPAARRAAPASGFGVQLGAFGSRASADREWRRLQERFAAELSGRSPHIELTNTDAGQLYRLQVAAGGESEARSLCNSLKEKEQACVPVTPR